MTSSTVVIPEFCAGIQHFGAAWEGYSKHAQSAVIKQGQSAISDPHAPDAVYQTLLMADALRYLTLQTCGSKRLRASGRLPAARRLMPRW